MVYNHERNNCISNTAKFNRMALSNPHQHTVKPTIYYQLIYNNTKFMKLHITRQFRQPASYYLEDSFA